MKKFVTTLAGGAIGLLIVLPGAPAIASSAPLAPPLTAPMEAPERLPERITDRASVLSPDQKAKLTQEISQLQSKHQSDLWVVFVNSFEGMSPESWTKQTAQASGLGTDQYLLTIAVKDRAYFLARAAESKLSASQLTEIGNADVRGALSRNDWAGAVSAASSGIDGALTPGFPVLPVAAVGAGGLALAGYGISRARKRGKERQQRATTLKGLAQQAGAALVDVDDAIRGARDELGFAQAEFGLQQTGEFTKSLTAAEKLLAQAFAIQQHLDDPATQLPDAQLMDRFREILDLTDEAKDNVHAHLQQFSQMRDVQSRVESVLAELSTRETEVRSRLEGSRSILATLSNRYPDRALASFLGNPERARGFLDTAKQAIAAGQDRVTKNDRASAVVQARLAEGAIGQAAELLEAVNRADRELAQAAQQLPAAIASISSDLQDADRLLPNKGDLASERKAAQAAISQGHEAQRNGDPVGALAALSQAEDAIDRALEPYRAAEEQQVRAQRNLADRLGQLDSRLRNLDGLLHTHRARVGPRARSMFTEAVDLSERAHDLAESDPVQAVQAAGAGLQKVDAATRIAHADLNSGANLGGPWRDPAQSPNWDPDEPGGRGRRDNTTDILGTIIAGQVLGNILGGVLGGGGHRGGGGFGDGGFGGGGFGDGGFGGGGFGDGGFGGGGFGGGDGGFGGDGGRF